MASISDLASLKMTLRHVSYVSYLVPVSRVRRVVPAVLALSAIDSQSVFVSVVAMRCHRVRLAGLPWPRFNYRQLNLRTYVVDPVSGGNAVYFLKSGVTSAVVSTLTTLVGLPWQHIEFEFEAAGEDGEIPVGRASGHWNGNLVISVEESPSGPRDPAPFDNPRAAIEHLTAPLVGFIGPEGRTKRFEIRHRALDVRWGALRELHFPPLGSLGLVGEEDTGQPHSVLMVPEAEFTVRLPPRRA
jgi:hypothetical protein